MATQDQAATAPICPIAAEGLQIEDSGGEVIVFDRATSQFHLLNGVAHRILMECNGVTAPAEIAARLAHAFDLQGRSVGAVTKDVVAALSQLHAKRLVDFVATVPEGMSNAAFPQSEAPVAALECPLLAVAVHGASMFPTLVSGDRVIVKRVTADDVDVGNILVCSRDDDRLIAHRVVRVERDPVPLITTKGDTIPDPDSPVGFDRVLGRVVAILRDGRPQWMQAVDAAVRPASSAPPSPSSMPSPDGAPDTGLRPFKMTGLKVLDLRDLSPEAIRSLESVGDVSVVLLSPRNADAWSAVATGTVGSILTVPDDYRVYTGQPELVPEMLDYLGAPLRLVVSGQLFLSRFDAGQITRAFADVILNGQAYVGSPEAKAALAAVTRIVTGEVLVIPDEHCRWIGESIVGPEYGASQGVRPLMAVGDVVRSKRLERLPDLVLTHETLGARSVAG